MGPDEEDDGQYREDPSIYWKDPKYNKGVKHSSSKAAAPVNYNPPPQNYNSGPNQYYQNNIPATQPQPALRQPAVFQPEPQRYQQYQAPQQPYYQNNYNARADFAAHPAVQNYDQNSGSYTITYGR